MAASRFLLPFPFILFCILFAIRPLPSQAGEDDNLLQGINSYRDSLNLTSLTKNNNAACLADEIAQQFKSQPCTNSTGANTVPGTEPQFSNYESLLAKCHLNVSDTRDGAVMPACIPNLVPSLVLDNFTQSQYSGNLNDTKYTGIGIGSEGDWIVVVLTTGTTGGSFSTTGGSFTPDTAGTMVSQIGLVNYLLFLLMAAFFLL